MSETTGLGKIPPVVWMIGGGVALLALMTRGSGGGGGGGYGEVTAYSPVPADPGILALESSKISAKESAFESVVGLFGARDVAARDVTIAQLASSVENNRTRASATVANYRTDAEMRVGIEQAKTSSLLAQIKADSDLALSRDAGATAKYVAKKDAQKGIWGSVIGGVGKIFGGLF